MIRNDDVMRRLGMALRGIESAPDIAALRKARQERDNTRIEELCEAVENLAIAISASALSKVDTDRPQHPMVTEYLHNSRQWLREAMRDFMTPNLHLVNGEVRQIDTGVPPSERIRCARCGKHTVCRNILCADWAAALKKHIGSAQESLPEDDGPRAA